MSGPLAISVVIVMAGFLLLGHVFVGVRYIGPDEVEHAHAAWSIARGLTMYRDFFEVHTPLYHLLLAAPLRWLDVEGSLDTALGFLRAARVVNWSSTLAVLWLVWVLASLVHGKRVALVAVGFLAHSEMYMDKAIELRPDPLGVLLLLGSLTMIVRSVRGEQAREAGRGTYLVAGVLFGAAVLATQKVLLAVPGLLPAAAAYCLEKAGPPRRERAVNVLAFVAGGAAVLAVVAVYFAGRGALVEFVRSAFLTTVGWKVWMPASRYGLALVRQDPLFVTLAGLGLLEGVVAARSGRLAVRGGVLLYWPAASLALGIFWIPTPFPQYFMLFLPSLAVAAAAFLVATVDGVLGQGRALTRWLRPLGAGVMVVAIIAADPVLKAKLTGAVGSSTTALILVLAACGATTALVLIAKRLHREASEWCLAAVMIVSSMYPAYRICSNLDERGESHRGEIAFVYRATRPHEVVLDGWPGRAMFRPHALWHFFLTEDVRALIPEEERRGYVKALVTRSIQPALIVLDEHLRAFLPEVMDQIQRDYRHSGVGDLWVLRRPGAGGGTGGERTAAPTREPKQEL